MKNTAGKRASRLSINLKDGGEGKKKDMLISIDTSKEITRIPHRETYNLILERLSDDERNAISEELNRRITGNKIHTAGWIPGNDWMGTTFQVIYEKAARGNFELAGRMFGLILWVVFQNRDDTWASDHYEKDGIPIQSRTYFRVNPR